MKPPYCRVCERRFNPSEDGGDLIYFKKRPSDKEWDKKRKEKGIIGHPPYAAWFCEKHYEKAKQLDHLTIDKAMEKLQEEF